MAEKKQAVTKRRIGNSKVYSDKFKLLVATYKRDVSYNKQKKWEHVEHCHFFHSFDSYGREMKECVSICGHSHKIEKIGEMQYKVHPAEDGHTHTIEYIDSCEVEIRKANADAIKFYDSYASGPVSEAE